MPRAFGRHTTIFISAALSIAGGVAFYYSLPFKWLLVALPFALWEAWTIANDLPHDTISETIWRFNKSMPLVPFVFGVFTGWLIGTGQLDFTSVAYATLMGHLFFSRACKTTAEDESLKEIE